MALRRMTLRRVALWPIVLRRRRPLPFRNAVQRLDQRRIHPGLLLPRGADLADDHLDPVDCLQNQCHDVCLGRQLAITDAAQHILRGVRDALQPREAEEAAGALDRVHQPKHQ